MQGKMKGIVKRKLFILTMILLLNCSVNAFSQSIEKEKLLQFEEAITRGEEFLQLKDYAKAKAEYQKALTIDPNAKYPKDKLIQIRKIYTDPQDEVMYNNAVAKGDQLIQTGNYKEAKDQYSTALIIKPDDRSIREKISNADKLMAEKNRRTAEYNRIIETADSNLASKNYQLALNNYRTATELDPTNNYPLNKIKEIETLLAKGKALNDNYDNFLAQADEAYMSREFSLAKIRYEEASRLKPSENYPKSMLEKVEQALVNQAKNDVDLQTQKLKELAEQKRIDSLKSENERNRLEEMAIAEENKKLIVLKEKLIQDSIKLQEDLKIAELKRIEDERISENKKLEEARIAEEKRFEEERVVENDKIEKEKEAAILAETQKKQRAVDSIQTLMEQQEAEKEKLAAIETKKADSLKTLEEAFNANKLEQERLEYLKALDKARTDSINAIEQAQIRADKKAEEDLLAEAARLEEEKKKQQEFELKTQNDIDYAEALEQANRFTTDQDYPSAIKAYEIASELKPMEEYPKDRIIALHNLLLERLKNNLESYNKFIAAGDLAYQSNIFDKAIDEYSKALLTRPEETYPSNMIDKIKKLMEDNAMIDLVENTTILLNSNEQRFNFKPIDMRLRKNNYIVIKARKTTEKAPKVFINYGKDSQKSGGIVMKGIESDETSDYLLRISIQDSWYRVDNNWISIYPEGGDIEVTEIQISQGDIEKLK